MQKSEPSEMSSTLTTSITCDSCLSGDQMFTAFPRNNDMPGNKGRKEDWFPVLLVSSPLPHLSAHKSSTKIYSRIWPRIKSKHSFV